LSYPCLLDIYAVKGAEDQENGSGYGVYDNLDDRAIIIHSPRLSVLGNTENLSGRLWMIGLVCTQCSTGVASGRGKSDKERQVRSKTTPAKTISDSASAGTPEENNK